LVSKVGRTAGVSVSVVLEEEKRQVDDERGRVARMGRGRNADTVEEEDAKATIRTRLGAILDHMVGL
jgi:hypothetical protein